MPLRTRRRVSAARLWLPRPVLEQIASEADTAFPDETGGAFVGYEAGEDVVVTNVIRAGPRARRTTVEFEPDAEYQLEQIALLYAASGRLHTYIGDWHTHPGGPANCSYKDKNALRTISRDPASRCPRPVMLILGDGDPWTMTAWRHYPGRWWDRTRTICIERC